MTSKIDYHQLIQKDKIHGSIYTSDEVYADEIEKIFQNGWVYIGHESEIKKVGDYLVREVGRSSVIMVRDKNGLVNVHSNRCTHRGNMLCNETEGNKRNFTCPYHGWVFNLDGELMDRDWETSLTR